MRPRAFIASLAGVLVLAALAMPAAGEPNFQRDYSDPASDVEQLWTANMTAVTDQNGDPIAGPFPDSINIIWTRSANATNPANVTISVETQGSIVNHDNTSYEFQLFTTPTNGSYFRVTYVNMTTTLDSTDPDFTPVDLTGNSTISNVGPPIVQNRLRINVEKSHLGPITAWNVRLLALQTGATYTYRDWGWELPGNPGSAPTIIQGVVSETGAGTVLASVNVSTDLGGYWTLTNGTGAYSLSLAPGTYNVTFTRDGYVTYTTQLTVSVGETRELDAQLTRLGFGLGSDVMLWISVGIAILAGLAVLVVLMRRRREQPPPPSE